MSLELYHWAPNGPWLKPLIVIMENGIDCQLRPIDVLAFDQYSDATPPPSLETSLNPEGEGPLLVHDGRQVTESFFMSEYLDAVSNGALRPTVPLSFNRMLAWARHINEVLMPAVNTLGCATFLAPALAGKTPPDGVLDRIQLGFVRDNWLRAYANAYPDELMAESRRKVEMSLGKVEAGLAGQDYLLGDRFTLADIDLFSICRSLPRLTPELTVQAPLFSAWLERIEARPSVQAALEVGHWEDPATAFAPGPEHARWG